MRRNKSSKHEQTQQIGRKTSCERRFQAASKKETIGEIDDGIELFAIITWSTAVLLLVVAMATVEVEVFILNMEYAEMLKSSQ
jgi:hypothetical protein